jgi:hypothetical protein
MFAIPISATVKALASFAIILALTLLLSIAPSHATSVADPAGDAGGGPDIISVTGTYNSTTLFLSVLYATGTFNSANNGVLIGLNTDLNTATGCCTDTSIFFPVGAEYAPGYDPSTGKATFRVVSFATGAGVLTGDAVTPTFLTNGFSLAIPLSFIGGNGLLEFGVATGTDNGDGTFSPTDFLGPDDNPTVDFGPTSVTPLPTALPLFATGLSALGLLGWRRKQKAQAV